jgi:hypothetical protein
MKRLLLILLGFLFLQSAHAHKPSDSYLTLRANGATVDGQWDIALRDLDFAIGLDTNGDAQITWGEVRARQAEIDAYAMARLQLTSGGRPCPTEVAEHLIDDHTDGAYAVLRFKAQCAAPIENLEARYSLFFDIDPQHKGLLRLEYLGASSTGIFSPETAKQTFKLAKPNKLTQFFDYGREGVWHIWIGFDHILFLLALLLPAVVYRERKYWDAVGAFKPAFMNVLKIVTAFTVAHSITLSLATLGIVSLPSRLVESTIAASVVIAALNNIFPLFRERRWMMAFVFGLIHGFGFASVLTDLGLPRETLVIALVGFNLGVEAGQLAIVSVFLPVAYRLRHTLFYRRYVLIGGSAVIAIVAGIWFAERAFDFKVLPF